MTTAPARLASGRDLQDLQEFPAARIPNGGACGGKATLTNPVDRGGSLRRAHELYEEQPALRERLSKTRLMFNIGKVFACSTVLQRPDPGRANPEQTLE